MCNSGFYRIPGSNIHFSLSVFFLFTTTLLIVLFSRKSLLFLSFSLLPFLCNLPLPFIMKFWPSRGTIGSPVLPSCEQSLFRAYHLISPISHFSHSFLLSALILLKVPGWLPSSGCAKVCPSRPHRLAVPLFPFFSHLGGILFCQLESRLLPFSFLCFSVLVPRDSFCLCHERSLGFFGACVLLLCFLFSFSVLFFRAVLVFLLTVCLEGSAPLDGC